MFFGPDRPRILLTALRSLQEKEQTLQIGIENIMGKILVAERSGEFRDPDGRFRRLGDRGIDKKYGGIGGSRSFDCPCGSNSNQLMLFVTSLTISSLLNELIVWRLPSFL